MSGPGKLRRDFEDAMRERLCELLIESESEDCTESMLYDNEREREAIERDLEDE